MNTVLNCLIVTRFAALAIVISRAAAGAEPTVVPAAIAGASSLPAAAASPAQEWLSRVNATEPGTFPPPRSFDATYRMRWSDVDAARAEVTCTAVGNSSQIVTKVTGGTVGLARSLYQVDATYTAVADRLTLRPVRFDQKEVESRKRKTAHVEFDASGAERTTETVDKKSSSAPPVAPRKKTFSYPGMFDMHSALLFLRSLPLANGDSRTLIVMTAGNPYLATIKVVGRGTVKTSAGSYPAIECSIALSKINKRGALEPHKSFKSARVWISDGSDRLVVKAEAQVFIGTVTLELVKVSFPAK